LFLPFFTSNRIGMISALLFITSFPPHIHHAPTEALQIPHLCRGNASRSILHEITSRLQTQSLVLGLSQEDVSGQIHHHRIIDDCAQEDRGAFL
jgi:hypothetical protein